MKKENMTLTLMIYLNKKSVGSSVNQYDHFSVKMPSKKVEDYELIKTFEYFDNEKVG